MRALILLVLLSLSACSLVGGFQAVDEHLYRIPAVSVEPVAARREGVQLVVKDMQSDVFLNSQKIIFSADGIEQGFYQYANWAEPPPKRFTTLLLMALDQAALFQSATSISAGAIGNYQLNTVMLECFHDTSSKPGKARIKVRAELVEALSRKLVAQRLFETDVELKSYDARGAVDGISEAMQKMIREIVGWLDRQDYKLIARAEAAEK